MTEFNDNLSLVLFQSAALHPPHDYVLVFSLNTPKEQHNVTVDRPHYRRQDIWVVLILKTGADRY